DWSDTPNPQVPGYDLEFNTSPNFAPATSVLLLSPSRSDYMITRDLLAPGNYFWRVRALHGDVVGLWSAGRTITVTAPVAPPNVNLFAILAGPGNAYGGATAHARVMLANPARGVRRMYIASHRCSAGKHAVDRGQRSCRKNRRNDFQHRDRTGAEQWRLCW